MSPEMRVGCEKTVEAQVICRSWSADVEIDGVKYVFLGAEDEGAGDEGTGRECGYG